MCDYFGSGDVSWSAVIAVSCERVEHVIWSSRGSPEQKQFLLTVTVLCSGSLGPDQIAPEDYL